MSRDHSPAQYLVFGYIKMFGLFVFFLMFLGEMPLEQKMWHQQLQIFFSKYFLSRPNRELDLLNKTFYGNNSLGTVVG
jgi:hypothetical protein